LKERTKGIGILPKHRAIAYGCSGPVLRGSGVSYDVRKNDPYSSYEDFDFEVPLGSLGDSYDRYSVRMAEMWQSMKIIEQVIKNMPDGPYRSNDKLSFKLPKGQYFSHVETARGDFGTYIVADGTDKPYRIKSRSPSFSNLGMIDEISKGFKVTDLVTILSTIDLVIPDIDR